MIRSLLICTALSMAAVTFSAAQPPSPPATAAVTIAGKTITIKYAAPSVRGRKIFGEGGRVSQDPTYPVWRVGANSATALHADADLDINSLQVPKGDYTIFALVNTTPWELIINKQTGQWGLSYNKDMDLGRVKMSMSKPPAPIETFKISLSSTGANTGKLQLEWENVIASVPFKVK